MSMIRLNKYLAHQGVASRREVDRMVGAGRISVNGEVVRDKGRKIEPGKDKVLVDGRMIEEHEQLVYMALHKPVGVLSAVNDGEGLGRTTVVDLVVGSQKTEVSSRGERNPKSQILSSKQIRNSKSKETETNSKFHRPSGTALSFVPTKVGEVSKQNSEVTSTQTLKLKPERLGNFETSKLLPRVYPVGRLDVDSRGLMLLTNDGELTHRLTHPKWHVAKRYVVQVSGEVTEEVLKQLREGVEIKGGRTQRCEVRMLGVEKLEGGVSKFLMPSGTVLSFEVSKSESVRNNFEILKLSPAVGGVGNLKLLEFTLFEGRHRQIRRMCGAVGLAVHDLLRVGFGGVELGTMREGRWRWLTAAEVVALKRQVQIEKSKENKEGMSVGESYDPAVREVFGI